MLKTFYSINLLVSEDELRSLQLNREDDSIYDDDELQKICDSVEIFNNDISLAVCIYGDSMYEIDTTHNRHNLYLFEAKAIYEGTNETVEYETVNATNISSELDEIKTYTDLVKLILFYIK